MKVLVFAPHADDEILGCGGTIARYIAEGAEVHICIVTNLYPPIGNDTIAKKNGWPINLYPEVMNVKSVLGIKKYYYLRLPAVVLETVPRFEINEKIQNLIDAIEPDMVFIPHFGDMQKDHTLTSDAVMIAVRPNGRYIVRCVYSYETLSETEWNIQHVSNIFMPNMYIDISNFLEKKLEALSCYHSQVKDFPHPRSIEAVKALAMYRGSTCGVHAAEAFSLIREYR